MISNDNKVLSVLTAYRQVLKETKRAPFVAVKIPLVGSKHWQNCIKIYECAESVGVSVPMFMKACLDDFAPWWCQKIFKRTYPPVQTAVAERVRNRVLKLFPKTLKSSEPDALSDFYVQQLLGFGPDIAKGLIANGLCGDDPDFQELVFNKFKEAQLV